MTNKPHIPCPHCGFQSGISTEHLGRQVECPKCRKSFNIPIPLPTRHSSVRVATNEHAGRASRLGETGNLVRITLIGATVMFLAVGAVKFLAANAPSFSDFAPGGVFAGVFIVFELLQHFLDVLPQYTLSTAVAVTAFFTSVVVLFFALYDEDPGKQSLLSGFGGSLLGFATGIPFGQLRLRSEEPKEPEPK